MNMAGSSKEERSGAQVTYILTALFSWLGGLVGWLIWRNKGSYAKDQTTEAFNYGITTGICFAVLAILTHVIPFMGVASMLLWIAQLVLSIMGCIAAGKGETYRYPLSLRLLK
jgi:uncharacterized protein